MRATVNALRIERVEVEVTTRDALYAAWAAWLKTRLAPHNAARDVESTWPQRHDIRDGKWVYWLRSYYVSPSELDVPATANDCAILQAFHTLDALLLLTQEGDGTHEDGAEYGPEEDAESEE